jgi:hypothetical protein
MSGQEISFASPFVSANFIESFPAPRKLRFCPSRQVELTLPVRVVVRLAFPDW